VAGGSVAGNPPVSPRTLEMTTFAVVAVIVFMSLTPQLCIKLQLNTYITRDPHPLCLHRRDFHIPTN
jgi:hypothetical protein